MGSCALEKVESFRASLAAAAIPGAVLIGAVAEARRSESGFGRRILISFGARTFEGMLELLHTHKCLRRDLGREESEVK